LSCLGFTNPNAASLSLAPFARNAGSAAALMGFLQIGLGAVTSMMIGILSVQESFPVAVILSGTSLLALAILLFGQSRIRAAAAGPV